MLDSTVTLVSANNPWSGHHYPKFTDEETEPLNKQIKVADVGVKP